MDDAWIRSDFKEVDKRDELGKVLGWLRGENGKRPIITDGKLPFGILHTRALMGRNAHPDTRIHKVSQPVPCIQHGDGIEVITRHFAESLAPYLPVRDPERGVSRGYIDAMTALKAGFEAGPKAHQAYQEAPALRPNDPMEAAVRAFAESPVDHLAVVDDQGRLKGVLHRSTVYRVQEFEDQSQGRQDFAGTTTDVPRSEPVGAWMESTWAENLPHDGFGDILANLETHGVSFAVDKQGRYQGVLTPAYMIRRAREVTGPPKAGRTVTPHFRR